MTFEKKIPTINTEEEENKDTQDINDNNKEEKEKNENVDDSKEDEYNDELEVKQSLIDKLKKENDELERKLMYLVAEYENSKKRNKIEIENTNKFAITKFAIEAVNVYDVLETALLNIDPEKTDKTLADGVKMTINEFEKMFEKININKIVPEINTPFDHNKHEAISRIQSKFEIGNIVKVVRNGYELYGRLLRPAMVIVSGGE